MKIFISLPMSGYSEEQILNNIQNAKSVISKYNQNKDIEFITSYIKEDEPKSDAYYLGMSIKKMSECDIVYFYPGWNKSRGCSIEHEVAKKYNIPIKYLEDFLDRKILNVMDVDDFLNRKLNLL